MVGCMHKEYSFEKYFRYSFYYVNERLMCVERRREPLVFPSSSVGCHTEVNPSGKGSSLAIQIINHKYKGGAQIYNLPDLCWMRLCP